MPSSSWTTFLIKTRRRRFLSQSTECMRKRNNPSIWSWLYVWSWYWGLWWAYTGIVLDGYKTSSQLTHTTIQLTSMRIVYGNDCKTLSRTRDNLFFRLFCKFSGIIILTIIASLRWQPTSRKDSRISEIPHYE